jgi:hypothetical protein
VGSAELITTLEALLGRVGRAWKALMRRDVRFYHYDFPHSGIQAVMKKSG